MAQLLLFRGADFEQKTIQGTSLLRFAQLYGQEKVESLLRDYGARSDQGDTKKMKRPGSNGEAWRSFSTVGTSLSMNVPDKAQSPPHRPVLTADYEELVRAQTR
jgi:ankyrin repeat protein